MNNLYISVHGETGERAARAEVPNEKLWVHWTVSQIGIRMYAQLARECGGRLLFQDVSEFPKHVLLEIVAEYKKEPFEFSAWTCLCPCGYENGKYGDCRCTKSVIAQYQSRLPKEFLEICSVSRLGEIDAKYNTFE